MTGLARALGLAAMCAALLCAPEAVKTKGEGDEPLEEGAAPAGPSIAGPSFADVRILEEACMVTDAPPVRGADAGRPGVWLVEERSPGVDDVPAAAQERHAGGGDRREMFRMLAASMALVAFAGMVYNSAVDLFHLSKSSCDLPARIAAEQRLRASERQLVEPAHDAHAHAE
mmetsp:Transcript_55070/g.154937  ORF Transcript_55070/g.154937 Transcript_55070/m.154937 type:complete len:172 (-) Transcript_55070:60-575(-)